jgi:hypothetical protein
MRTTVNIDGDLLRRARELAARHRRSLGDVVDDALRIMLAERDPAGPREVELPVYGGSGLQPGVDLEDKEALAALLGDDEPARAAR